MPQQKLKLSIAGLYTHPNTLGTAPEGALAVADNIVIDRENIAESRRGFVQHNAPLAGTGKKLFNFRDTLLAHQGTTLSRDVAGVWTDYAGTFDVPAVGRRIQSLQANQNFYATTSVGVIKLDAVAGTPGGAGAPRGLDLSTALTGASGFMANDTSVAYRIVWGYVDANMNLILGAPSARSEISNTSGGTRDVSLNFTIPSGLTVAWFYQVYRSLMSGSAAVPGDDELQLSFQRQLVAGDLITGTITVTDSTPEELLGAALYTNSTQDGILQANDKPPYALDLATFKDFTFYFNTKQPHRLTLTMIVVPTINDTVTIDGKTYTAKAAENIAADEFQAFSTGNLASDIMNTVMSLIRVINRDAGNTTIYAYFISGGSFFIERRDFGAGYTATCSNANVFQQAIPVSSDDEANQHRLYISKFRQPEAVPLLQFIDVGRADKEGVRILSIRDALFALKEDGIFRLTGTDTTNFIIEQHDTTVSVIGPECPATLGNEVFCVTDQGVLRVNISGSSIVSRPIENRLLNIITLSNFSTFSWGTGYDSDRKYFLGVPASDLSSDVESLFVYNWITDSWTNWPLAWKHAIVSEADNKLYAIRIEDDQVLEERKDLTLNDYADDEFPLTITLVSGNDITVTDASDAVIGYTVKQGGSRGNITGIAGNILTLTSTNFNAGAATMYKPIRNVLRWVEESGDNPGLLKHFPEITFFFERTRFLTMEFNVSSNFKPAFASTTLRSKSLAGWGGYPWGSLPWGTGRGGFQSIRTYLPREQCRALWVNLELVNEQAFSAFSLAGASLIMNEMSSRFK